MQSWELTSGKNSGLIIRLVPWERLGSMQRREIGHCNNIPIWRTVNNKKYLISNIHKLKQSALTQQTNDIGDYRYSHLV